MDYVGMGAYVVVMPQGWNLFIWEPCGQGWFGNLADKNLDASSRMLRKLSCEMSYVTAKYVVDR